jgi:hypothetical protein
MYLHRVPVGPNNWLSMTIDMKEGKGKEIGGEGCNPPGEWTVGRPCRADPVPSAQTLYRARIALRYRPQHARTRLHVRQPRTMSSETAATLTLPTLSKLKRTARPPAAPGLSAHLRPQLRHVRMPIWGVSKTMHQHVLKDARTRHIARRITARGTLGLTHSDLHV